MKPLYKLIPTSTLALGLTLALTQASWATTLESCGGSFTFDAPPERAITLNQQATEVMLALGLEDSMVGTAYMDDEIPEQWRDAYEQIPVLAERFPAAEVVLAADPDFLFAGFGSAFSVDNLGPESDWHEMGVGTYLVDASCSDWHPDDEPKTTDPIFNDLREIGRVFDVSDRAEALIDDIEQRLEAATAGQPGNSRSVFVYDSNLESPYSVGCCGGPALLMNLMGLESISDVEEGNWVTLSWEFVVENDPELIVLIEADWSTADEKRQHLESDPVLVELTAVQASNYIVIPFSETLLGMRFVDGVERLAAELEALD